MPPSERLRLLQKAINENRRSHRDAHVLTLLMDLHERCAALDRRVASLEASDRARRAGYPGYD